MGKEVNPPSFPWESQTPDGPVYGFVLAGVQFKLLLGYAVYPAGVLLYCFEQYLQQEPQLWRRHWTSKEAALEAAESLVGDAEEYFESLGVIARPVEDLSFDDYLQHIEQKLNHALH